MTDPAISNATVYQGEVQLLSWTESDKGRKAVFMLDPHVGEQHPFRTLRPGRRLMVVAVLIGDDEQPEPVKAQRSPAGHKHFRDMKRSAQAALKCQDADFQYWIGVDGGLMPEERVKRADELLKRRLSIVSKTDLDRWPEAGANWDNLLTSYDVRGMQR